MIVTSGLSERELESIVRLANGAELLVLGRLTLPTVLLFLVDERLRQLRADHAPSPRDDRRQGRNEAAAFVSGKVPVNLSAFDRIVFRDDPAHPSSAEER